MQILGLQKMTLLDYPSKIACTVFLGGCNFRCPFCHNPSLVLTPSSQESMSESDFFAFLDQRVGLLDGVCITGGEPLLTKELIPFLKKIKEKGFLVKVDTNGSFPDTLEFLQENSLVDYIAMDIKNSIQRYGETIGVPGYETHSITKSVELLKMGKVAYEFRTTLIRELHSTEDIHAIGEWLSGDSPYYLQTFVDTGNLVGNKIFHPFSPDEMRDIKAILQRYMSAVSLRGI